MTRRQRRLVILAEGEFRLHAAKTALGVIRYGPDSVLAVVDSTRAGANASDLLGPAFDVPVVATLDEVLPLAPTALLIGIAPTGGRLPAAWRSTILRAIHSGLDVLSGLHTFVSDDPEFAAAARAAGVELIDFRKPPERMETSVGRLHRPGSRVILTVGTDCAIGKMSVALELRDAARESGLSSSFVATGQTGIVIEGWGVAVDRVVSDFLQGTCEWMSEQGEERGDWVFVEGQGSLDHPAYSSVTLGLIHGFTPHAMVLVHKPGLAEHDFDHLPRRSFPLHRLPEMIRLHEEIAGLVAPSRVAAVGLNTSLLGEDDARREIERTATETGLPCDDPFRFGGAALFAGLRKGVEALPWIDRTEVTA